MTELSHKRALIVGAGGLGSPVALILARAGVGELHVADDDRVELSNLHRQVLFEAADVGQSKARCAALRIAREAKAHGHAQLHAVAREMRLRPENARALVRDFDVVVEGSDNYATKFLVADACALERVACVQAGAVRWMGWVFASLPGESACLRCVFEDMPSAPGEGCAEAGVIGPVVGAVGALQAALALRLLLGDASAASVLHHYRALPGSLRSSRLARARACRMCAGEILDLDTANYLPRECAA